MTVAHQKAVALEETFQRHHLDSQTAAVLEVVLAAIQHQATATVSLWLSAYPKLTKVFRVASFQMVTVVFAVLQKVPQIVPQTRVLLTIVYFIYYLYFRNQFNITKQIHQEKIKSHLTSI